MSFPKLSQKCVPGRTCPGRVPDVSRTCAQNVPVLTILGHLQIGRVQRRAAGWAHAVAIDSSSNGCTWYWCNWKLFAHMWNSLLSPISAMRHLYANWYLLEIRNRSFPVTTTLSRRSRLWSFGHFNLIFALGWKKLAWSEPRAPIPLRFLTIEE